MIIDLEFAYSTRASRNLAVEATIKKNLDIWLKPLEQEINEKKITVGVVFVSHETNYITLLGADADLYARFMDLIKMYVA